MSKVKVYPCPPPILDDALEGLLGLSSGVSDPPLAMTNSPSKKPPSPSKNRVIAPVPSQQLGSESPSTDGPRQAAAAPPSAAAPLSVPASSRPPLAPVVASRCPSSLTKSSDSSS